MMMHFVGRAKLVAVVQWWGERQLYIYHRN